MIIGESYIRIRPDVEGFEQETTGKVKGIAGKIAGVMAGAFAAQKVGSFLVDAVGGASDLGESVSKIGVVFGASQGKVLAFGETAAKTLGLSRNEANAATGTFGNLFTALGLTEGKSADMATELTTLAADLGSFNNVPVTDALDALRAGLAGEAEPLKRFGVNMNDATLKAQALKMGLIATEKDALTPAAKAQAAYGLIVEQTGKAQGDFGRTSDGLANRTKILKARFADFQVELGQKLLPIVNAVAGFLLNNVGPAFGAVANAIGPVVGLIGGVVGAVAGFITGTEALRPLLIGIAAILGGAVLVNLVAWGVAAAVSAGQAVAGFVASAAASVAGAVRTVASNALMIGSYIAVGLAALASAAQIALAWIIALGPVALVIAAVVGLVVIIVKNFDTIKNVIAAVWEAVSGAAKAAWDFIVGAVSTAIGSVIGFFTALPGRVLGALGAVGSFLLNAGSDLVRGLVRGAEAIVGAYLGFYAALPGRVLGALGAVGSFLVNAGSELLGGLKRGVEGAIGGVIDFVSGIPGRILRGLGKLGDLLLDAGGDIISGLVRGLREGAGRIVAAIKSYITDKIPGPVKKVLGIGSPSRMFAGFGHNIAEGLALGLKESTGLVDEAIGDLLASVTAPSIPALTIPVTTSLSTSATAGATGAAAVGVSAPITISATFHGPTNAEEVTAALRDVARTEVAGALLRVVASATAKTSRA